jgi:hypothetical protein
VPASLATTDEAEFRRFLAGHSGRIAAKRLVGSRTALPGGVYRHVILTHRIEEDDLVGMDLGALRHAPSLYQEYVDKRSELRVYVAGNRVIPFEIFSQAETGTSVDWRRFPVREGPNGPEVDLTRWRCAPTSLPTEVEERCRALVRRLGLRYSAIDLIRTPDERLVFLEANFGGAYAWIERATGVAITEALVDLLVPGTQRG